MGLYITAWFEGKDKKGQWFLANPRFVNLDNPDKVNPPQSLDLGRLEKNYLLYAALGDVRNDNSIPYIQRLRGIPKDATDIVKEEAEDAYDSIGKGYVTAKELESYYHTYINNEDETIRAAAGFIWDLYLYLLHITFGVRNYEEKHLDIDNTRLIFWFE